jgi:hypothetical protein
MIFVSAYTPLGYINNKRHEFGSVLRFAERNFGLKEGALNFSDARAMTDLRGFYDLSRTPRTFETIAAPKGASDFIKDTSPATGPDNI